MPKKQATNGVSPMMAPADYIERVSKPWCADRGNPGVAWWTPYVEKNQDVFGLYDWGCSRPLVNSSQWEIPE